MNTANELRAFVYNSPELTAAHDNFFHFVIEKTTSAQYRECLKMSESGDVLYYLVCAYGCYALTHHLGWQNLIMNPEKLFSTKEEQETFVELFLNYAREELAWVQAQKVQRKNALK